MATLRSFLRAEQLEDRSTPATLSVSTLADAGAGSLRQAILDANNEATNPGSDTIVFSGAAVAGTVNVTTMGGTQFGPNAFEVTSTIVVQGTGEKIARDGAAPNFRLFYVSTGGNLTLSNVTVSNGRARGGDGGTNLAQNGGGGGGGLGAGGAIYNQGTVSILNSTLSGNTARGGNGGAGADAAGTFAGGGGGGGGMGGDGGTTPDTAPQTDGGAGGGGFFGDGVAGAASVGGGGGGTTADAVGAVGGVTNGGAGGPNATVGTAGGLGGGGGGGGEEGSGAAGGIGGGGGGGGENDNAVIETGGAGGFGGGGGGGGDDGTGGAGGFGGGGGGGSNGGAAAQAGGAGGDFAGNGGGTAATQGSGGGGGGAGLGGAIFNDGGTITITGSTLSANNAVRGIGGAAGGTATAGGDGEGAGGGLFNHTGTVTIRNSTVTLNTATGDGGGLTNAATMTVSGSTITDNVASSSGGGIRNVGALTVDATTIATNKATTDNGGGINNGFLGAQNGTVVLTNSTLSGNIAQGAGGGIRNVSPDAAAFRITNTTIVDNKSVTAQGGGINTTTGTVVIVNATITGNIDTSAVANRSGGISATGGTVTLANSVIANNTTADMVARDVRGVFVVAASKNNFLTFVDANTNIVNGVNGNVVGADAKLGPLQNNGGPTQTRLPLATSPLLNAGLNAAVPAGTVFDQRGNGSVRLVGVADIGAVEVQPPTPLLASGQTNGSAAVFVPNATGTYPGAPAATVVPFGSPTVNVRVAAGDVNGDGFADSVLVTGPGTPIRVAVVSGADNVSILVAPFDPFGGDFSGGGFVAAGDIDNDGRDEFVISPDQGGGPRITIFSLTGGVPVVRSNYFGIDDPAFRGGAQSALGDVNRDGVLDLVVTAGFLGGPRAALFNGTTILTNSPVRIVNDFFAFPGADAVTLRNGSFVTAGDVNGDGFAELIFGGGPGGAPRVFILSGALISANDVTAQATPVANFFVAGNSTDRGGVRLATTNADGDNRADVIAGSGEGSPARARVYLGANFTGTGEPATFQDLNLFGGGNLPGGVFVG